MKKSIPILLLIIFSWESSYCKSVDNISDKFPFIQLDHYILVKARINDSADEYNLIVDTGGMTILDKTVVQQLGLKQRGPMAKISVLDLSGVRIENIFCFTTFDMRLFRRVGTPIHGIIGSDLMERFKVTFDFRERTITFSSDTSALTRPENGLYFPFRNHPVNHAPVIQFKIDGKIFEGMIDTGQPYPLVLPLKDLDQYADSFSSPAIRSKGLMVKWPMTAPDHNVLTRLKSVDMDGLTMHDPLCIFGELPAVLSMPLIGTDLLSQFQMIINYPMDEMVLIPGQEIYVRDNMFSVGLNLNLSGDDEIFVEGLWGNSPADKARIEVGDRVVRFDSKEMTIDNLIALIGMLKDEKIKSIKLEIKNPEGIRKLKLKKVMLF